MTDLFSLEKLKHIEYTEILKLLIFEFFQVDPTEIKLSHISFRTLPSGFSLLGFSDYYVFLESQGGI